MAKFSLDLKKFKKVSSDDDVTTLRHDQGHELKIAHKSLSPDLRKQLDSLKMADGGIVPADKHSDPNEIQKQKGMAADAATTRAAKGQPIKVEDTEEYKNAPEIKAYAQGTEDGPVEPPAPEVTAPQNPPQASTAPVTINIGQQQQPEKHGFFDDAAYQQELQNFQDRKGPQAAAIGDAVKRMINPASASPAVPGAQNILPSAPMAGTGIGPAPAPAATAPTQPATGAVQPPSPEQSGAAPADSDPSGIDAYQNSVMKGLGEQERGINQEAAATGALGKAQAPLLDQSANFKQRMLDDYQHTLSTLNQEHQDLMEDIRNQHVDPNHYLSSQGTGQRIGTAIGLILGGMGGGITHQGNPVLDFINKQIDNDINAQRVNLGKSENLLSANMKQYNNARDAMDATRAQQMGIVADQLQQAAANAADPIAKARALQQMGNLHVQSGALYSQIALRKSMMNAGQSAQSPQDFASYLNLMRVMNPEFAKGLEKRYVPNVGVANIELPQDTRDKLLAHQSLDAAAKDLNQWTKSHTTLIPSGADYNVGAQKALNIQQLIRHGLLNTVYREGEQPLLDKLVNENPGNLLKAWNTEPKLQELIRENGRQFNQLKQSVGLPVPKGTDTGGNYKPKSFKKAE